MVPGFDKASRPAKVHGRARVPRAVPSDPACLVLNPALEAPAFEAPPESKP